jgi:hypothetical protein
MCAFRIASLFTRNAVTGTPEPTKTKPVRNQNPIQEKVTAASVHVNEQLDSESTKNIKSQPKKRPLPNNLYAESAKLNTAYQVNLSDSKSLQSERPISEADIQEKIEEDIMNSRSDPKEYKKIYASVSETGKAQAKAYGLNNCEVAAIHAYTGAYSAVINPALRTLQGEDVKKNDAKSLEGFLIDTHLSEIISDYYKALEKLPPALLEKNINIGLGRDVTLPANVLAAIKEGDIISESMFTSTTRAMEQMVDNKWWRETTETFIFHQRVNGNGRDISAYSAFKHECEIVFLPDTKFKVTYRKDGAIVGRGADWGLLKGSVLEKFFSAFPEEYLSKLSETDIRFVKDTLGESFPYNLKGAKELIEKTLQEECSVDLEAVLNEIKNLYTKAYGGPIESGTEIIKTIITFEEISPDEELKINLEKSLATSEKGMTARTSSSTTSTKSAETERKISVRDQKKTTAQPITAAKPSSTKESDSTRPEYSPGDASHSYGDYFPGFIE